MKEKLARFMQGRYGNDQLNNFLMKTFLVEFILYLWYNTKIKVLSKEGEYT